MHSFVSLNGRIIDQAEARIRSLSGAALFGKGVFTTIGVYGGKPHLWEKHWRRLVTAAAKLDISLQQFSESTVQNALEEVVTSNGMVNGRARITFFDGSPTTAWPFDGAQDTRLLVMTAGFRPPAGELHLGLSTYRVNSMSPLAGIKSCNYLEHLMAYDEANGCGFDEAVRLNERGEVTSACMANIFWLKDERLFTPSLKTGCLAGTTREFVMENLDCEEVAADLDELRATEAIFLTSAGLGVVRVSEYEGRELAGDGHPILGLVPRY